MYKDYFLYILEHKKNVFKACIKRGLFIHALTHDLSKFLPWEFIPYAHWFNGEYGKNATRDFKIIFCEMHYYRRRRFNIAFKKHYKTNKHHWNHWIGKDMPKRYIKQMICDWEAMSYKLGNTVEQFYIDNYDKINLSLNSRLILEHELGLIDNTCLLLNVTLKDYCKEMNISLQDSISNL